MKLKEKHFVVNNEEVELEFEIKGLRFFLNEIEDTTYVVDKDNNCCLVITADSGQNIPFLTLEEV